MKAIIENGKTYKVTGEKGDFWIAELNGKVKVFAKRNVEVVEVEEIKEKKYRKPSAKSSNKNSNVNLIISLIQSELDNSCSARRIIARIESQVDMTDIVKSILSQANNKGGNISEKQVYVVAKFMSDNSISANF